MIITGAPIRVHIKRIIVLNVNVNRVAEIMFPQISLLPIPLVFI